VNFYLGCAVWSYKEWVGNLYPPRSKPADFLNLYSRRFLTVEGNTTFYAIPSAETIAKWVAQTPQRFKFCPKLNRNITHQGLLMPMVGNAVSFLERMSGLGDRLGTTFIQLPPSYSPQYFADLAEFLAVCNQSGLSLGVEVRHFDWFKPEYNERLDALLNELKIAKVLLDTRSIYNCPDNPQANSQRKKPNVPLKSTVTGDIAFIRFISHPNQAYNQIYLAEWLNDLHNWFCQGKTVYFFVHCPEESRSPDIAKYFYNQLKRYNPGIPDLPWNNIDPQPTQLTLF